MWLTFFGPEIIKSYVHDHQTIITNDEATYLLKCLSGGESFTLLVNFT